MPITQHAGMRRCGSTSANPSPSGARLRPGLCQTDGKPAAKDWPWTQLARFQAARLLQQCRLAFAVAVRPWSRAQLARNRAHTHCDTSQTGRLPPVWLKRRGVFPTFNGCLLAVVLATDVFLSIREVRTCMSCLNNV
jgi:hypothetical protein